LSKQTIMKQVIIVVPDGYADMSTITGSFEMLTTANERWKEMGNRPMLEIRIAGFVTDPGSDAGFFAVRPTDIREINEAGLVIIPSLSHYYYALIKQNAALITWIREQYKSGAEIASLCTGAFLLAATGLLEGKRCSTHWGAAGDFKTLYPGVDLTVDKLITAEEGIYTNGGSYSFLNLMLFLVEKYFDRETAIFCSKMFQVDIERTLQSPFVIFQTQKNHGDELIIKAQTYIEENLSEKISFEELASKLAISRRNFDRRFTKAVGNTPVEYLQRVKVELAKSSLEKGRKSVFEVMSEIGYSDDKAFREVFKRITGLSPLEYRARFAKRAVPA
jgi:transcriptional regulator GlxA family with amidase domain